MILEIVGDLAGFEALKPWWDALLEQSSSRTPFMRWDWVRLWWEEFQKDYELAIAVVREAAGTEPLALAPLMIGPELDGMRKHLRHLGFLAGLGEAKGERMDFLVPAGREPELTPLLCQAFRKLSARWQAVRLNKLPEESPNRPFIVAALETCSAGAGVVTRTECAVIRLAPSWKDFEAQLSGKRRRDLRRRRELFMQVPGAGEALVQAEEAGPRLDEFAALHALHYPAGVSSFLRPRAWSFHRRLGLRWLADGRAMLSYLHAEGRMVGAIYGFIEGPEFLFYQIGWHPDYARHAMGHQSVRWASECCMERGVNLFDMLPGSYRYKEDWAQESRHVLDLEAYQPESVMAAVFRTIRRVKRLLPGPKENSPQS